MTNPKSMMVYASAFAGAPTFRLLPLTEACPFNEAVYDPEKRVLALILKDQKEMVQGSDLPSLLGHEPPAVLNEYYEHYLEEAADIRKFLSEIAVNPQHEAVNIVDLPVMYAG
jgi:hypothetical protein